MLPTIWPGARLRIDPVGASQLRAGDILLVERGADVLVHRAVSIVDGQVITQGDHCRSPDPPVPLRHVLGRVRGLPLGPVVADLPGPLGAVSTRASARAARWAGRNLGMLRSGWSTLGALAPLRHARARLAPWRIEALDRSPEQHRAILLRRARPPSRAALAHLAALAGEELAFVAIRRGVPVAYAAVEPRELSVGWLDLWVDVPALGLRIEHALVMRALDAARAAGLREVRARTRTSRAGWMMAPPLRFRALADPGANTRVLCRDLAVR